MTAPISTSTPTPDQFFLPTLDFPGQDLYSPALAIGDYLKTYAASHPDFRLFSPDETTSNKLDALYSTTSRAWGNLPLEPWDLPSSPDGRIVELLSENALFATMLGTNLAGHPAMITSYEAFFAIITSQIIQHLKFLEQSAAVSFRPPLPAANLLSTSTCWRQDHNGFTHQSPLLISTLLSRPSRHVNCLFPVDDVAARVACDFMLSSTNVVNLTTFNKTNEPRWIDSHHAKFQYEHGASIFQFASDPDPDFIFTAAGDIATRETLYAIKLLKKSLPDLKLRFVGLNALTSAPLLSSNPEVSSSPVVHHPNYPTGELIYGAIGTTDHQLDQSTFNHYFTPDRPIIANFHGFPAALRTILANYTAPSRLSVHGFIEQGSTTTPFEMLSLNRASRYHLALDLVSRLNRPDLVEEYRSVLRMNTTYAYEHGLDLPTIQDFKFML